MPDSPTDVPTARARLQVAALDALRAIVGSPRLSLGIATALAIVLAALATWAAGYIGAHTPSTTSTQITVVETPAPDTDDAPADTDTDEATE